MRSPRIALAIALALAAAPVASLAVEPATAPSNEPAAEAAASTPEMASAEAAASTPEMASAEAAASTPEMASAEVAEEAPAARKSIVLGPLGKDAKGRSGRIHQVQKGDTLWDVSDAYLGTPWVWPSIWRDNGGIADPHVIHPGERIWITPEEMRRVSEAEAAAMIAAGDGAFPADLEMDGMSGAPPAETFTYTERQTSGFVSPDEIRGDATVVGGPENRALLSSPDHVLIGLGAGEVEEGDQFAIFRTSDRVFDPDSGVFVGFATQELGWLEVTEVHAESANATIKLSRSEVTFGDHLRPRHPQSPEIELRQPPEVEGRVVYTPDSRLNMSSHDVVYLDRGVGHGLEVGSPLEVYRVLGTSEDAVRGKVGLPDRVVAKLLVVEAREETAVAVVTHARGELLRGDRFRGSPTIAP